MFEREISATGEKIGAAAYCGGEIVSVRLALLAPKSEVTME
jgi:hypothetical protein